MRRLVFSAFLLFIGIIVGVTLSSEFHAIPPGQAVSDESAALSEKTSEVTSEKMPAAPPALKEQPFIAVSKAVIPAVVNIAATRVTKSRKGIPGFPFSDPLFKRFFGEERQPQKKPGRERKSESLGSGVIIQSDGLIVTNYHVVENADEIVVLLADKREFKGEVVGTDPKSDLAIIRINADKLPSLKWGDSSQLQVGEYVLAVGSPFGFTQTVTMGIVSAIGRGNIGLADYEDFIQTDAAINPGNSGGAMVNVRGELVGINTAIFTRSGGYMGIGFAVPSNMARSVVESLAETGKVIRGWLGVAIQDLNANLAKGFGLEGTQGALVSEVMSGSPAEEAGFQAGDVILSFGGETITDTNVLRNIVAKAIAGDTLTVEVIRDKKPLRLEVHIKSQPKDMFARSRKAPEVERRTSILSGLSLSPLTGALAREMELDSAEKGLVVMDVEPGSPSEAAGLKKGDLIVEANRTKISELEGFEAALSGTPKGHPVLLLVRRKNRTLFLTVTP